MKNAQSLMQAYIQAPWRRQMQFLGLFLVILIMLALLASLYLSVSASAAAYGRQIQQAQYDIQTYRSSIADLETQLAELNSTTFLRDRAEEIGLHPASSGEIVYLSVPGYSEPSAIRMAPPPGPAVASRPGVAPEFNQSMIDWLIDKLAQVDLQLGSAEGTQP